MPAAPGNAGLLLRPLARVPADGSARSLAARGLVFKDGKDGTVAGSASLTPGAAPPRGLDGARPAQGLPRGAHLASYAQVTGYDKLSAGATKAAKSPPEARERRRAPCGREDGSSGSGEALPRWLQAPPSVVPSRAPQCRRRGQAGPGEQVGSQRQDPGLLGGAPSAPPHLAGGERPSVFPSRPTISLCLPGRASASCLSTAHTEAAKCPRPGRGQ